ncbi:MAG: hypothetical protein KBD53_05595 [Candidatus Omnitrophica bacterium]|nr:hypothetical protein [Candidatus Omnitrophota bacterium]
MNVAEGKFILAHSEGTLNLGAGIKLVAASGMKFQNLEIKWIGSVISRSTAAALSNSIHAQSQYYLNLGDPVGIFTTVNPIKTSVYGTLGISTMTHFHRTNSYVH